MTIAQHDCRDSNSNAFISTAARDILGRDTIKSASTFLAAMMWSRLVTAGEPEYEAADTTIGFTNNNLEFPGSWQNLLHGESIVEGTGHAMIKPG